MKWEEHLKHQLPANGRWENDEQLYRICLLAYAEGCNEERKKALEAYRLRCGRLFVENRKVPTGRKKRLPEKKPDCLRNVAGKCWRLLPRRKCLGASISDLKKNTGLKPL